MSRWSIKVAPYKEVTFEVIGKNTDWEQFGRIKASPGREYKLADAVGSKVTVGFNTGDSIVHFVPYCKDTSGHVKESFIRCYNDTEHPCGWLLYMEDGDGVDFDDSIVRVSVNDARAERVGDFKKSLADLDYHVARVT